MHVHFLFVICFAHFMSRHTPSIASVREIGGVWLSLAHSAAAPKTSLLAPEDRISKLWRKHFWKTQRSLQRGTEGEETVAAGSFFQ